jgi:hypothetical protein
MIGLHHRYPPQAPGTWIEEDQGCEDRQTRFPKIACGEGELSSQITNVYTDTENVTHLQRLSLPPFIVWESLSRGETMEIN